MISNLYNLIVYEPLLNTLAVLYQYVTFESLGFAIIALTIIVRLVLFPMFHRVAKHQRKIQKIQPEVKRLQELHKDDRVKQSQAIMDLYKAHGVNPFSQIGIILAQLPIFFALNSIFNTGFSEEALRHLYTFVPHPENVSHIFLGIDLTLPHMPILILAAAAQFLQARLSLPPLAPGQDPAMHNQAKIMSIVAPVLIILLFSSFPAALALFFLVTTAFSIVQQFIANKHIEDEEVALSLKKQ